MVNLFKKIERGASHFFKKVDSGTATFFDKQLPNAVQQVGNNVQKIGGEVAGGVTNVGNFLEKNSGVISDAAAGALYATGAGAPLATAVLAAGNTAQQLGGRLKNAGQQAKQGLNTLAQAQQGVQKPLVQQASVQQALKVV